MKKSFSFKLTAQCALTLFLFLSLGSCKKYLDAKSDKALVVISTYADLQALLDNYNRNKHILSGEVFADNYYLTPEIWASMASATDRNAYIWENEDTDDVGWSISYSHIYNANVVLEELEKIKSGTKSPQENSIKGTALFMRAYAFYELLQLFAKPYDEKTSSQDSGIPLRLSADINVSYPRSTVMESYAQVLDDYSRAIALLPENTNYPTRPNKAAAYAAMARTFLTMEKYENARIYADSSLLQRNTLLDYNELKLGQSNPIALFNQEVLFHTANLAIPLLASNLRISPDLYDQYKTGDIRKAAFFIKNANDFYGFNGSYSQSNFNLFSGIATDEVYLIRAEANARTGRISAALADLNFLLKNRWDKSSFTAIQSTDPDEVLYRILQERRKELIFRGTRWSDLRRLNKDPKYAIQISRTVNGKTYVLAPGSNKYISPIPYAAIEYSGIEQNVR